jgi:hypothetical protein
MTHTPRTVRHLRHDRVSLACRSCDAGRCESPYPGNTASASRASGHPRPTPRLNRSMILTGPRGPQRLTQPNPIRPGKQTCST